jgi:hypothetical protein
MPVTRWSNSSLVDLEGLQLLRNIRRARRVETDCDAKRRINVSTKERSELTSQSFCLQAFKVIVIQAGEVVFGTVGQD